MYPFPPDLRRTSRSIPVCRIRAKETKGDWVSLVVDHGKAPKNGSYEYAVLPQTTESAMKAFAKKPGYKVLKQDRNAHIVQSLTDNLYSYVLF